MLYKVSGFVPATDVPDGRQPWRDRPAKKVDRFTRDRYGVRMFEWRGKLYNHPVAQIQYGLQNLSAFRKTGDVFFLNRARLQAERVISKQVVLRGAFYFPYPYNFSHGQHSGLNFRAPWYSGMAQGESLSLFSQLARLDAVPAADREEYREAAERTFPSLQLFDEANPWVVNVDDGYYWIQEYPALPPGKPDYTYNGFIFAILGLWDYHLLTGDPVAAQLFDASLTTIDKYFTSFRNPGGSAYYCRTHRIPTPNYHTIHIVLLYALHFLSGDERFKRYAELLKSDV